MRIKKFINSPVRDSSGQLLNTHFQVQLNPFKDYEEFVKTKKIAYKLFSHLDLDCKILVDICSKPENTNQYSITVVDPKATFLGPFIISMGIWREIDRQGYVGGKNYDEPSVLPPVTTFSIHMKKMSNYKLYFQLNLSNSAVVSSNKNDDKNENDNSIQQFIKEKKFLQEYSLSKMLKSEENSRDFTIMAGNSQILVHKLVLSVQSKVFAQMLSAQMDEARNSLVEIIDIPEKSVKIAIDFMYSGVIEVKEDEDMCEVLRGLYIFAQKYDMVNLKWSVFEKCHTHIDYFSENPGEKHKFIQIATLHETGMEDLNPFLAIFGPYPIK